ncbi:hypothetical protein ELS07_23135 [Salmonella enterica subsp. enterica serovar Lomalinda]|nr:hypothetical protein [Salmonella enterica subsp. enterica serovar Lomalinda]ECI5321495.1 hypothetical protein [Salmonella enterica subsp. enterica serovar Lomalinda]
MTMLRFKCINTDKISHLLKSLNINYFVAVCSEEWGEGRVGYIVCWSGKMENMVEYITDDTFVITPEYSEALLAASLSLVNGVKVSGILIANEDNIPSEIINFCSKTIPDDRLSVLLCRASYEDICTNLKLLSMREDSENCFVIQNVSS